MAGAANVQTLDPTQASSDPNSIALCSLLYQGLVRIDAGDKIEPAAARSWRVFDHGLRYVFTLRRNLRFSNGTRVTAGDVVASFRRALGPGSVTAGQPGYMAELALIDGSAGVFTPGPGKVEFLLTKRSPGFLAELTATLTFVRTSIVDIQTVHRFGPVWTLHADGTGPYTLANIVPDKSITLAPNRFYIGAKPISDLHIQFASTANRAVKAFQQDRAEVVTGISASDVPSSVTGSAVRAVQPDLDYVLFNTRAAPFNRTTNRLALATSVDRSVFVNTLSEGMWVAARSVVPAALMANALTREAVAPRKGLDIRTEPVFVFQNSRLEVEKAHLLARMWRRALGLQVRLKPMTFAAYASALETGSFNIATVSWGARFADPSDFLNQLIPGSLLNFSGWDNPRFEGLMLQSARRRGDSPQRRILLSAAAKLADQRAPWIPLDSPIQIALINPETSGVSLTPFGIEGPTP